MRRNMLIAALTLVPFAIPISTCGVAYGQAPQAAPAGPGANDNEVALKKWLASAGLARQFEVIRVGDGPHPDPPYALETIQHLEVRFITVGGADRTSEAERFQQTLADYETAHAVGLPEKLFDEFVSVSGVSPANACVDVHLFGAVYSVYLSRADGSLITSQSGKRSDLDSFSINIPVIAAQQQFHARLSKQSALDPKLVRAAVDQKLRAYLDSISGKSKSTLDMHSDTTNNNYLRLVVDGARGMVTDGYWEHIDIFIFFSPDAAAAAQPDNAKGKDVSWNFVCKVEMKYASSQHEPKPQDADNDFPQQTAAFRMKLVHQLQTEMEKGIND